MKNKKDMVKQTEEITKTESGPFDQLSKAITTLRTRPILIEENTVSSVLLEKQLKQITFYRKIISKNRTKQDEQIKIKKPVCFSADVLFDQVLIYIGKHGGINTFINKINSNIEKIDMILTLEHYTGKIIKHYPIEYYKIILEDGSTITTDTPVVKNDFSKALEVEEIIKQTDTTHTEISKEYSPFRGKLYPITVFLDQYFKGLWDNRYFTVPSKYDYWNALLLLFTGNPGLFRKAVFKKAWEDRTPEEQAEVEAETQKIISVMEVEDPRHNTIKGVDAIKIYTPKMDIQLKKNTDETGTAGDILFDEISPKKENRELFNDPEYLREKTLKNFYDTIGSPEGLRHFMAILEGLDDAGQKGFYTFKMDEHLDRLGFKKHNNAHRTKHKEKAIEVIRTLSNTVLEVEDPENEKYNVSFTLLKTSVRHDKITRKVKDLIISMDPWYIHAFQGTKEKEPQFMRLLRELPKENHRDHPYTLLLTPWLALFWRIEKKPQKTLMLSNVLAFLNINNSKTFKGNIRILESELNYMKSRDHLGEWYHNGDHIKMEESSNPEKIKITFVAPEWAIKEINAIKENQGDIFSLSADTEINPMTKTDFLEIYEYLLKRYSQREMARHMGISRTNLSNFKSGKRTVTNEMAQKIRAFYFEELKKDPGSDGN